VLAIQGRNRFFIRAIRRQKPHPAITDFRLCKEFGWTPTQLAKQPARTIHQFTTNLNEIDRQTEEEKQKTEKEAKKHEHYS
jgi:site-specific DNA-cytosine methylase